VEENLTALNKYYLIGIMSAGIIHELNNPVSAILANINMLGDCKDDADEIMDIITRNAKRINIMTSQLREYSLSASDAKASETSDITDVMNRVLDIMRNRLKYSITLNYEKKKHPPAKYSFGLLSQVMINILLNAAESIKGTGVIEIATSVIDKNIIIKISDTGCGIPDNIKLFEPFQTTKLSDGHAGIGLYVSKKIIETNGGLISCSSKLKSGTTVTITLPSV